MVKPLAGSGSVRAPATGFTHPHHRGRQHRPFDDDSVWAVTCFVVRREHRGTGLTLELLHAAVEYARESDARIIEGYPVDTKGEKQRPNDLFHGTLGTFLSAGFALKTEMKPGRALVVLDLAAGSSPSRSR